MRQSIRWRFYDAASGKRVASLHAQASAEMTPDALAFSPDGSWVAWPRREAPGAAPAPAAGAAPAPAIDVGVQSLDAPGSPTAVPSPPPARGASAASVVWRLIASSDGTALAIEWDDGVSVVRAPSGQPIVALSGNFQNGAAFSSSGRYFAAEVDKGTVLVDVRSGDQRVLADRACGGVGARPVFSHDESRIAVGGSRKATCVYRTGTGRLDRRYPRFAPMPVPPEDEGFTRPVAWTPKDDGLLVASVVGVPTLWNVDSGRPVPIDDVDTVRASAIRPDGSVALVGENGWPVASVTNGTSVVPLLAPSDADQAQPGGTSPDGELVAVASGDDVLIVSTRDASVRARFPMTDLMLGIDFDPRSRFVYADSGPLRVMDAVTGSVVLGPPPCGGCPCK